MNEYINIICILIISLIIFRMIYKDCKIYENFNVNKEFECNIPVNNKDNVIIKVMKQSDVFENGIIDIGNVLVSSN